VRNTVYFDGANTHRAIFVVALWALGGLLLALIAEKYPLLPPRPKRAEAAPAPAA